MKSKRLYQAILDSNYQADQEGYLSSKPRIPRLSPLMIHVMLDYNETDPAKKLGLANLLKDALQLSDEDMRAYIKLWGDVLAGMTRRDVIERFGFVGTQGLIISRF